MSRRRGVAFVVDDVGLQYDGTYTRMMTLPNGTEFYVVNGAWNGKVVHKEDGVYLQTSLDDAECVDGSNQLKLDDNYHLWIVNVRKRSY